MLVLFWPGFSLSEVKDVSSEVRWAVGLMIMLRTVYVKHVRWSLVL